MDLALWIIRGGSSPQFASLTLADQRLRHLQNNRQRAVTLKALAVLIDKALIRE